MQQYFVNKNFNLNSEYELSKEDSNHIVRVMRKNINDKLFIVFNDEIKYICNIIDNNIDRVIVEPFEKVEESNELKTKITVAIPPLKNDKIEYLLQKLTELGVFNIILFNSERNIAKIKADKINSKLKRWDKILKEAAEQSKRNIIPTLSYVNSLQELINTTTNMDYKVVAYEKESINEDNYNLKKLLNGPLENKSVIAVFGSEGGLSEKEINTLTSSEFDVISLGKRILRAETAPLYFTSCVSYFSEFK